MVQPYLPLEVIPYGPYCYDENGNCPYWSSDPSKPRQENGHCALTGGSDWDDRPGFGLLWDQCKECDHNWDDEDAGNGRRECDWIYLSDWQVTFGMDFVQRRKVYQYGVKGVHKTLALEQLVNGY